MDRFITPSLPYSATPFLCLVVSRWYALIGLLVGYLLVMLANPVRPALRDGFRCLARYERIWLTFALWDLPTSFSSSLPLAHFRVRRKSISRRSFPFPTGIGRLFLMSGGMFRYQRSKEWPVSSTTPPLLIRSLLWRLFYFSLTGAACSAHCGAL